VTKHIKNTYLKRVDAPIGVNQRGVVRITMLAQPRLGIVGRILVIQTDQRDHLLRDLVVLRRSDRCGADIVEPAVVSVDATKVERIIENLVSNALRHTPPGTNIWVRARGRDGGIALVVEDEGRGIPTELRDAIFEPFRQAPGSSSEHSPGVGVGLSLVRRFAELHGGRAWLEDRPGGGSSFHVFLPGG